MACSSWEIRQPEFLERSVGNITAPLEDRSDNRGAAEPSKVLRHVLLVCNSLYLLRSDADKAVAVGCLLLQGTLFDELGAGFAVIFVIHEQNTIGLAEKQIIPGRKLPRPLIRALLTGA